MKKHILILVQLLLILVSEQLNSQTTQTIQLSPGKIFDKVSDRFGNSYALSDLMIKKSTAINYIVPTQSCIAGYYKLFFASGSIFSNSLVARTALCALFTDLSGFISSPLSVSGNTNYINIYCSDTPTNQPNALGTASPYFVYPQNPSSPNQGILDNQIYKYIVSGIDPFVNLPAAPYPNAQGFYHGYLNASATALWNFNLAASSIASNEYDFYSIMLHEATHSLGFFSLINFNGQSLLGSNNNYYSRFDQFLRDPSGAPLLSNGTFSCPLSGLQFQGTTTVVAALGSSTNGCVTDITNCTLAPGYYGSTFSNIKLYTPNCYENGSSLSHFEDMCPIFAAAGCATGTFSSANNNKYYTMSNANGTGNCYIKRYLKEEEKAVLCDLGYSVNPTFTSSAAAGNYTYSFGGCSGPNLWGIDDGLSNGVYTFTVLTSVSNTLSIPTSSILQNDAPTATISCLEVVYNNATVTTVGSNVVVTVATGFSGLVVIKYLPKNSSNQYGNATYIYCYFISGNCNPVSSCNLIQNGGFENVNPGFQPCGQAGNTFPSSDANINCWDYYSLSPDLYYRYCPNTFLSLGTTNTFLNIDSYNGSPNDRIIYCWYGQSSLTLTSVADISETVKNNLSSALIPNNSYNLSFLVQNPFTHSIVVTVASSSNQALAYSPTFPSTLNVIGSFTIPPMPSIGNSFPAWFAVTHTFVFNSPGNLNHYALVIGPDGPLTGSLGVAGGYCFLDEISLLPITSPSFVINQHGNCAAKSFSNLAQYASPVPGNFTGVGVSYSNNQYSFNYPPSLPPGNYAINFNYTTTSGCVGSIPEIINIPGIDLGICNTNRTITAKGFDYNTTYTWTPIAGFGGPTVLAFVSGTTIFTLVTSSGTCQQTYTASVAPCCTQSTTSSFVGSLITANITSPTEFNQNVTIPPNANISFTGSEFIFAPNVKLTVSNGAVLNINSSHLYGCANELWQGIVVLDGGKVIVQSQSLLEDAKTAIDVANHSTSVVSPILEASQSTFNKNYIDINISNYTRTTTTYPFIVKSCVFTCRNLPFTSSNWPQTGTASSASTTAADLRYVDIATTATTGLNPPYLNQSTFSITTLKSPYNNQTSHIAINLATVGITTGPAATTNGTASMPGITIGDNTASNFNVFDAHGSFIVAKKSNVTLVNNVFQNTQTYTVTGGSTFGGSAVNHAAVYSSTDVMHTMLNMYSANVNVGNRFWNCHRAIELSKTYLFWLENAIIRSTQSTTNTTSYLQGNTGIYAPTNNFDYYIGNNEFTNLKTAINIPVSTGFIAPSPGSGFPTTIGIFAHRIRIHNNIFAAGTGGTNFMEKAIDMTCPNATPWLSSILVVPGVSVTPFTQAFSITNNLVNNAYRGFSIIGSHGFQVDISNNDLTLKDNSTVQRGIELNNCLPTTATDIGKNIISSNEVSFSAPSATTNTQGSLIFCGDNGYGIASPSVSCNNLVQGYEGFVFDGPNSGAVWAGNDMTLPIARGFMLDNAGFIGQQGGLSTAISNRWLGGTWNGTNGNYGTYIGSNSIAQNSAMWVKNTTTTYPPANSGTVSFQQWFGALNTVSISTGGDYNCAGIPNYKLVSLPNEEDYSSADQFYMAKTALYRFLHFNDSVYNSNSIYSDFYDGLAGSSIDKFMQIEEKLYQGSSTEALVLNNGISPTNTIETNYKNYYGLYAAYLANNFLHTNASDKTALLNLAGLCPGTNGACVYQAIALYNTVYGESIFSSCDSGGGSRMTNPDNEQKLDGAKKIWDISIFPNPAGEQITIVSKTENEILKVLVKDLSGRTVLIKSLKTNNFITTLDLSLPNGAYIITIANDVNEKVTKKLLIAK